MPEVSNAVGKYNFVVIQEEWPDSRYLHFWCYINDVLSNNTYHRNPITYINEHIMNNSPVNVHIIGLKEKINYCVEQNILAHIWSE